MAEKEYIEREAAIDALTERNLVVHMDSVNDGLVASCHRSAQRIIANISAANVRPVVLCKDCKWTETDGMEDPAIYCEKWDRWEMLPDGFCWLGEKREES